MTSRARTGRRLALPLCLFLLLTSPRASDAVPDPEEIRAKNRVGAMFPVPLEDGPGRRLYRDLYTNLLAEGGRAYLPLEEVSDPLAEFKRTGDPRTIPNPRGGGRGNNENDLLTNRILAWLLFDDPLAREEALLYAEWLAAVLHQQDHGHVQRHPSLALAAVMSSDPGQRSRLLTAFLTSYRTLQQSRFWQPGEQWTVGLSGVRPFFRAVGAAHRFAHQVRELVSAGFVDPSRIQSLRLPFPTQGAFLYRVDERLVEFLHWRKQQGDDEPRGWQTEPGLWQPNFPTNFWPYLDSRVPSGRNSTWFHYGQILPFELLCIRLYSPGRNRRLFRLRAAEISEWAFAIGADFGAAGASGLNMVSRRDWFFPGNPQLDLPFRDYTEEQHAEHGENTYCLLPAFFFIRGFDGWKSRAVPNHVATSKFALFAGEVSFSAVLTLHAWR